MDNEYLKQDYHHPIGIQDSLVVNVRKEQNCRRIRYVCEDPNHLFAKLPNVFRIVQDKQIGDAQQNKVEHCGKHTYKKSISALCAYFQHK